MRQFLTIWLLLCAVAVGLSLGSTPLLDADEGRNAEVGREMAATNDYVLPRLNALPYLDKPIVYFAAEAAAMEILGPTETAARLPAYLFTLATAALVFWFGRRVWGPEEGLVAAVVYLAMPLTIAFARTVIFDSALTFFIVLAIMAFYFAVEMEHGPWAVVAWAAMGLGVITKGPVALALPLLVAIPYAMWRRRFGSLWSILGLVLFALAIGPWVWGVSRAIPDFLRYVFVTETAERLTTTGLKRTGPPWYFVPYLLIGALPWSIAAMTGWHRGGVATRDRERQPATVFLLLWIFLPFIFFSISQSKRPQYILPVMAAVALLIAARWRAIGFRAAGAVISVFGLLLIAAPFFPQFTKKMQPVIADEAKVTAWILGLILLAGGLVAVFVGKRCVAIVALSLPMIAIPLVTAPLLHALAERRSAKSFVAALRPWVHADTQVIGVEAFTGSMAFYLRQPITVASDDAAEFTSNYLIRHYSRFSGVPGSSLQPLTWFRGNLDECCTERIYVVRNDDRADRAILESRGMRPIATAAHHVAYGPYRGTK